MTEIQNPGVPIKADTTGNTLKKICTTDYNDNWAKQLYATIQAEIDGRKAAQPHSEVILIGHDVVQHVEPADTKSSAKVLVTILDHNIVPELYAWPVFGIPVSLVLGNGTASMQNRYVKELREYFPKSITSHIRDKQGWLGPFEWSVGEGAV